MRAQLLDLLSPGKPKHSWSRLKHLAEARPTKTIMKILIVQPIYWWPVREEISGEFVKADGERSEMPLAWPAARINGSRVSAA